MTVFYVSAINGTRKFLVSGPYPTHAEALALVNHARRQACERDPRGYFMEWGTASSDQPQQTLMGLDALGRCV